MPDEPLVTIGAGAGAAGVNFLDLWSYHELLYFLVWRDLKVRYKQTALGVAWVVLQPLLATVVFTLFLGVLARVPSDNVPYPVFAFAGLLPWTFFANAIGGSSNSLVGNANLITKVYFPRVIIPGAAVSGRLVDFAVSLVVLAGMMAFYGVGVSWGVLLLPVFVALLALLALGIGMWTSALNVKYRDVAAVMPVLIQFWMFVSPILYPKSFVPERWQTLYSLNPLVGIIEGFRNSLFGRPVEWAPVAYSAAVTLCILVYAAYAFRRVERGFADVV